MLPKNLFKITGNTRIKLVFLVYNLESFFKVKIKNVFNFFGKKNL